MAAEIVYQLIHQTKYELLFDRTTLEAATDVVWTREQIQDEYNGGSIYPYEFSGDRSVSLVAVERYDPVHLLYRKLLIDDVLAGLDHQKTVRFMDMSEQLKVELKRFNREIFEPLGFCWRGEYFSKFNARPTEKKKVSGSVMISLKAATVYAITRMLREQFQIDCDFKPTISKDGPDRHGQIVKYFHTSGLFTIESLMACTYWNVYVGSRTFEEYLKHCLKHNQDMYDRTAIEYKKWLENVIK